MSWLLKLAAGNPLILVWIAGGVFLAGVSIGGSGAWWLQGLRLDAVKAEYAEFKIGVKALGDAAIAAKKQKEKEDADRKAKWDRERAALRTKLDGVYSAYGKLRDQRARGSLLPETPAGAPSPPRATFDRPALDRSLREFDKGVTGLLREGDQAVTDLNVARSWAQER